MSAAGSRNIASNGPFLHKRSDCSPLAINNSCFTRAPTPRPPRWNNYKKPNSPKSSTISRSTSIILFACKIIVTLVFACDYKTCLPLRRQFFDFWRLCKLANRATLQSGVYAVVLPGMVFAWCWLNWKSLPLLTTQAI